MKDDSSPAPEPEFDERNAYLGCRSKRRYDTEVAANRAAAVAYQAREHWLRAYPCNHCRGWHLTHKHALPAKPGWRPPARPAADVRREREEDERDWRRRRGRGLRQRG